jgi:hypothetical protein
MVLSSLSPGIRNLLLGLRTTDFQLTCFLHAPIYLVFEGRTMVQTVSSRLPITETRPRSQTILCGICGGQSGNGTVFAPSTARFPFSFIPPTLRTHHRLNATSTGRE